jgi:hypothetical protein
MFIRGLLKLQTLWTRSWKQTFGIRVFQCGVPGGTSLSVAKK